MRPRLVCLLPVRNGAGFLPGWFESVGRFADAVVALDDGSTDGTPDLLRAHWLVADILAHPQRPTGHGWNDSRNRNELLRAAAALDPDWIISIDADERLDGDDAAALRCFVDDEALAGCGYGFPLYRMLAAEHYDPMYEWVYRLFAFRAGQSFPERALDFIPIPDDIPAAALVRTTIRIKHYGEPDEAGRIARIEKFRQADPEGRFASYYEQLRPMSQVAPFPRWEPRLVGHPVLYSLARHRTAKEAPAPALDEALAAATAQTPARAEYPASAPGLPTGPVRRQQPFVVCLLPARNCRADLADWFQSVARFADAVVALDDGSTDDTAALLRDHPMVRAVLTNPVRHGYAGWDDSANRSRLLQAAAALAPDWIISIDADERVPEDDGRALRRFIDQGPATDYAYGFPRYRMIGDLDHHDGLESCAWRLFAYRPGQVFPTARLHLHPIPTTIGFDRWVATTIRMQHLAAMTEQLRQQRHAKHSQADPDRTRGQNHDHAMRPPGAIQQWTPHPADEAPLPDPDEWLAQQVKDLGLALSVVIDVDDPIAASRLATAMADQATDEGEIIVLARRGKVATDCRRAEPRARIVPVARRTPTAVAHNLALEVARGDAVVFLTSDRGFGALGVSDLIEHHDRGAGVVGLYLGKGDPLAALSFAREPLLALGGFVPSAGQIAPLLAAATVAGAGFATSSVHGTGPHDQVIAMNSPGRCLLAGLLAGWRNAPMGRAPFDQHRFKPAASGQPAPDRPGFDRRPFDMDALELSPWASAAARAGQVAAKRLRRIVYLRDQ